jgi:hypothetical protein
MAKKTPAPVAPPKVSQLPLPISDSPLVIDLPDGQKLVIGKMAEGSVIEVATWRGTGRPDSRTSRLMLGMSPGNLADDTNETTGYAGGQKVKKPEGFKKYLAIAQDIFGTAIKIIKKLPIGKLKNINFGKIKLPSRKPKQRTFRDSAPVSAPASSTVSMRPVPSSKESRTESKSESKDAVDDWLAQIIKKAESSSQVDSKNKISSSSTTKSPAKAAPSKKNAVSNAKKSTKGKK